VLRMVTWLVNSKKKQQQVKGAKQTMSSSCKGLRQELIACMKTSPCMKERNKSFHDCVKSTDEDELGNCVKVRHALYECRRGRVRNTVH